jgi:hypothetical protein
MHLLEPFADTKAAPAQYLQHESMSEPWFQKEQWRHALQRHKLLELKH